MGKAFIDGCNDAAAVLGISPKCFEPNSMESIVVFYIDMMTGGSSKLPEWLQLSWGDWARIKFMRSNASMMKWVPGLERRLNGLWMQIFTRIAQPVVENQFRNYFDQASVALPLKIGDVTI